MKERKLIAAINMTLDGFCDHTAINPDEKIHQHYNELLRNADAILYGRITFELMEYWRNVVKNPTGVKATDEFAVTMDNISKIVFSRTLKQVDWETASLARQGIKETVLELKQSRNGGSQDILVGSRSLIVACLNLNLVDEFQLCIHPVIAGKGLPLWERINSRINLKLLKTKQFDSGAMTLYYEPYKQA